MNQEQSQQLAASMRERRQLLGVSASELARRANVSPGTITRLELAQIPNPHIESLRAIADALQMPITDLLASGSWVRRDELPTLAPYLRTKYRDMPAAAVQEIEAHFDDVARRHGIHLHAPGGPAAGEDE